MSVMTAVARPSHGGLRHEVDVNGRHVLVTDEPHDLGGTDTGPAPHELLAATLAACISTMIALYARRHDWSVDGLEVAVDYDNEATPRRFEVRLQLPAGLTAEQVARLRRVADTCPVRRAFEAGLRVDELLIAPGA